MSVQSGTGGGHSSSVSAHPRTPAPVGAQQAARNHPLFNILDFIATKTQSYSATLEAVDKRMQKLEDSVKTIVELQSELKQLVEEQKENSFSIEKTKYKVLHIIIGMSL